MELKEKTITEPIYLTSKQFEIEKTIIIPKEEIKQFDINKLALAVAKHETGNCTLGYGKMYNNCFGLKNGNTAPCKKIGNNRMCIYDTPEESYEAFKLVRQTWYKGMPNLKKATRYSGDDRVTAWLNGVTYFYNN